MVSSRKRKKRSNSWVNTWSMPYQLQNYTGPTGSLPTATRAVRRWANAVNGQQNPRYRDQIANNVDATTAYLRTVTRIKHSQPRFQARYDMPQASNWNYTTVHAGFPNGGGSWVSPYGETPTSPSIPDWLAAQAVHKLYAGMRSKLHGINAAEDLAEIKSFGRTVSKPMKQLRDLTTYYMEKATRQVNTVHESRILQTLAKTHLEYQFGIKPSLSTIAKSYVDIGGGIELAESVRPIKTRHGHPWVQADVDNGGVETFNTTSPYWSIKYIKRKYRTIYIRYDYKIVTESSFPRMMDYGLHFNNLPKTIYNCVPWTWALDMFINLDDIIEGLSFPWSRVVYCSRTIVDTAKTRTVLADPVYSAGGQLTLYSKVFNPGFWQVESSRITRDRITSPPRLPLVFHHRKIDGMGKLNLGAAILLKSIPLIRALDRLSSKIGLNQNMRFD